MDRSFAIHIPLNCILPILNEPPLILYYCEVQRTFTGPIAALQTSQLYCYICHALCKCICQCRVEYNSQEPIQHNGLCMICINVDMVPCYLKCIASKNRVERPIIDPGKLL